MIENDYPHQLLDDLTDQHEGETKRLNHLRSQRNRLLAGGIGATLLNGFLTEGAQLLHGATAADGVASVLLLGAGWKLHRAHLSRLHIKDLVASATDVANGFNMPVPEWAGGNPEGLPVAGPIHGPVIDVQEVPSH